MSDAAGVLVTIRISHYCEKARWALSYTGTPFVERAFVPLLHVAAVRRAGGRRTTPVLKNADGVFADSTDIVAYADRASRSGRRLFADDAALRADALALEETFDVGLGPHVRRLAYFHLLTDAALTKRLLGQEASRGGRAFLALSFPLVRAFIRRGLRIDAPHAERSRAKLAEVLTAVDARLADGRRYLCGDSFGAADLTLASLLAPVLGVPNYGARMLPDDDLPAAFREEVKPWRDTRAAEHVRRMYREHRDA